MLALRLSALLRRARLVLPIVTAVAALSAVAPAAGAPVGPEMTFSIDPGGKIIYYVPTSSAPLQKTGEEGISGSYTVQLQDSCPYFGAECFALSDMHLTTASGKQFTQSSAGQWICWQVYGHCSPQISLSATGYGDISSVTIQQTGIAPHGPRWESSQRDPSGYSWVNADNYYTESGYGMYCCGLQISAALKFHATRVVNADADGDGVDDELGNTAAFSDDGNPPTFGSIANANGHGIRVTDAADSAEGVRIQVDGDPTTKATLTVCGFTIRLAGGTDAVLTCGSVTMKVLTGSGEVVLDGGMTVVSVPAGAIGKVGNRNADGSYTVENRGSDTITVTVDGVVGQIGAGQVRGVQSWRFEGFAAPVDNNGVLNMLRAGQTVPLRWRLLHADGTPVTGLSSVKVTAEGLSCAAGSSTDALEELASGASGLRNLGNGYYQFNWSTPKSYANSCKRLRVDVGSGVTHNALFQFKS